MVLKRIELAPIALYTLAAGALTLSWVAVQLRVDRDPPRHRYAARTALADASDSTPRAIAQAAPRESRPEPSYRPALTALQPPTLNFVESTRGPVVSPVLGLPPLEPLFALAPARPEWRAGDASQPWRLLGANTLEWVRRGGQALGRLQDQAARRIDLRPVVERLVELQPAPEPKLIRSPAGLSGPIVVGPGDRLAMASDAARRTRPSLTIRQRDALDGLINEMQLDADQPNPDSVLRAQLVALLDLGETEVWAAEALRLLDLLTNPDNLSAAERQTASDEFAAHAEQGLEASESLALPRAQVELRQAAYAVLRRARLWQVAAGLEQRDALVAVSDTERTNRALRQRLQSFAAQVKGDQQGNGWLRYLKLVQLDNALQTAGDDQGRARRDVAKEILARLAAASLDDAQRSFATTGVVAALTDELHVAAADPVDVPNLISDLELYEVRPNPALAERIALRGRLLRRSATEGHQQLAGEIERNYRNANLRIAVAADLLRRLLPQPTPEAQTVSERIAGTPVRGEALTNTNLNLRLTPDPYAWRITLEARGSVTARTVADGGPAMLQTHGDTEFVAHKPLVVHHGGVRAYAADCRADSHSHLVGIRTDFDRVPLISDIIRSRAQEEFLRNQGRAQWETESRVGSRVTSTLDQQADEFVARLKQRYEQTVLTRAGSLGLKVEPIEVRTTDQRLIARLRFASDLQLGSHTPRNRAPADSLLSLQLHESLLNNALDGLELNHGPISPEELRALVQQRLAIDLPPADADDHGRSVLINLATDQPPRVSLADGRVELLLSFTELQVDASRFGDFVVHAYFLPRATIDGLRLEQVDPVQIEGRMRSARRAQLHAVFGKIMPPGRTITLATSTPEQRQTMAGLMVTQLIVDDGWLGLALGPEEPARTALRVRYVR
ncbi:hypothetical protein Pla123a_32990 [Posidoniimonas polymericola]|uniref:Uncharacterized protein n=1 Tax=Posidoniimonas polymericola TaxID=2528002 RepID=A0A5C5YFH4_9BACT|nr:hypothetical protein [Posidoniimonas polymericola]TWT74476.1 hypothetical protein Pla123a_32990 [Posidoniimonas polymericola]